MEKTTPGKLSVDQSCPAFPGSVSRDCRRHSQTFMTEIEENAALWVAESWDAEESVLQAKTGESVFLPQA